MPKKQQKFKAQRFFAKYQVAEKIKSKKKGIYIFCIGKNIYVFFYFLL